MTKRNMAWLDELPKAFQQHLNGRKIDVVSYGNYIRRETPVRVVEVHGNRIVVEDISRG